MAWIDEVRTFHSEFFKDSFEKLGLVNYKEMEGPGMGALIRFKNDAFKVQIMYDRGLLELYMSPVHGVETFRGIELFYSLVQLEFSPNVRGLERRQILGTRLDAEATSNFLLNNSDRLKELLNKKNYRETLDSIESISQERWGY